MRQISELSLKAYKTYGEMASQLEISENNVSKQVNNAFRVLKAKLSIVVFLFQCSFVSSNIENSATGSIFYEML